MNVVIGRRSGRKRELARTSPAAWNLLSPSAMNGQGDHNSERRTARRYDIRVPVEYEHDDDAQGSGTTWNLSVSGVRIENTSKTIGVGNRVAMRFSFFAGSFATSFPGSVVRHTSAGFAVQFDVLGADQIRLLDQALPGEV